MTNTYAISLIKCQINDNTNDSRLGSSSRENLPQKKSTPSKSRLFVSCSSEIYIIRFLIMPAPETFIVKI